jgi:hypothetical protein
VFGAGPTALSMPKSRVMTPFCENSLALKPWPTLRPSCAYSSALRSKTMTAFLGTFNAPCLVKSNSMD